MPRFQIMSHFDDISRALVINFGGRSTYPDLKFSRALFSRAPRSQIKVLRNKKLMLIYLYIDL